MRILVLGAGGTGGYFGGRLAESGADVTFLVRPARAALLKAKGLVIHSPRGDATLPVKIVTANRLSPAYDLVLLTCKAYDLDDAIRTLAPAIGPQTLILPLLNGMAHLERLDTAFGAGHVLGGLCQISATIDGAGEIHHLNRIQVLRFGSRSQPDSACDEIAAILAKANFDSGASPAILQQMWGKFTFLTTLAGMTCLMRGPIGAIVSTDDGAALATEMLAECEAVAAADGHTIPAENHAAALRTLTEPGSAFTASMLRDMAAGGRTEADHIVGDMLRRGRDFGVATPLLRVAYSHLQTYEALRA